MKQNGKKIKRARLSPFCFSGKGLYTDGEYISMILFKHKSSFMKILRESLMMILGAVLIWRGVWILLDRIDVLFFGGSHVWSAIVGVIIGVAIVLLADRDLEDVV